MKKIIAIVAMAGLLLVMAGPADAGLVLGHRVTFKQDSAAPAAIESEIYAHLTARGMVVSAQYENDGPPPGFVEGGDLPANADLVMNGPGAEHRWFSRWNRYTGTSIIALGPGDWVANSTQWDGLGLTYKDGAFGQNGPGNGWERVSESALVIQPGYGNHPMLADYVAATGAVEGQIVQITNSVQVMVTPDPYLAPPWPHDTEVLMRAVTGEAIVFLVEEGGSMAGMDNWSDPKVGLVAAGTRIGLGIFGDDPERASMDLTPAGVALFDSIVDYARTLGTAETPIPEPAGLGLVGLALLAMRRRRS